MDTTVIHNSNVFVHANCFTQGSMLYNKIPRSLFSIKGARSSSAQAQN
jgi:hypothetical protein